MPWVDIGEHKGKFNVVQKIELFAVKDHSRACF